MKKQVLVTYSNCSKTFLWETPFGEKEILV